MERRFSLAGGKGWLTLTEGEGRVRCRAVLPDDRAGLYKCWLTGSGGRALLGTFAPKDGALELARTLSVGELERQGAWPPQGGEAVLAFSFGGGAGAPEGWRREETPEQLMGEPLLARAAAGRAALFRREGEGFSLAYPWAPDRPFPLTPLFCCARLEALGGRDYVVFPFRGGGCPRREEL